MHDALLPSSGATITADELQAMSSTRRDNLRGELACPSCLADAYFIREARNGRRACFGARPHEEGCELASLLTEDRGAAALDEVDERINAGDVFRLEPNRTRAIQHVTHDPSAPAGSGPAARYVKRNGSTARISSLSMDRLLRQLVLREAFARSKTRLILSDNTSGLVRTLCVHMSEISDRYLRKRRVYWGTIRFPRPKDNGGAWLNTGSRSSPTLVIEEEELEALLAAKGLDDLEDLSGSFFAVVGPLRKSAGGKLLLFADDLEWLAIRPYTEDDALN